ncbi:MAG: AbrB/MazE/SpoVT family DNA-binding domain-containing protein [Tidjanibacter sp.]|nr:AbrB/MazE/SpoVT family DNA-binding domain-containing protein [Tidjanibacter sp.]
MQTEKDKYIFGVVKVGEKGQIVIPKEAREVFGIEAGDSLLVLGDRTKGIAIVKTQVFDAAISGVFEDR